MFHSVDEVRGSLSRDNISAASLSVCSSEAPGTRYDQLIKTSTTRPPWPCICRSKEGISSCPSTPSWSCQRTLAAVLPWIRFLQTRIFLCPHAVVDMSSTEVRDPGRCQRLLTDAPVESPHMSATRLGAAAPNLFTSASYETTLCIHLH